MHLLTLLLMMLRVLGQCYCSGDVDDNRCVAADGGGGDSRGTIGTHLPLLPVVK